MDYIGIDPGARGGVAVITSGRSVVRSVSLSELSLLQTAHLLSLITRPCLACLEALHWRPSKNPASIGKLVQHAGALEGMLIGLGIPYILVSPQRWQAELRCRSRGDKTVTKARALDLFPSTKATHATADALLLAEYARRYDIGALTQRRR